MLDGSQFIARTHINAFACRRRQAERRKTAPPFCDNSSFTVSANNLQALSPSITRTSVHICHTHRNKKKAPRTWSAKTNPQRCLNKSSARNGGKKSPLKKRERAELLLTMSANMAANMAAALLHTTQPKTSVSGTRVNCCGCVCFLLLTLNLSFPRQFSIPVHNSETFSEFG